MAYTTINKSTDYFNTKLYTGNGTAIGSGGNAITGVGHQPDFVWIKDRSASNNHNLYDAVRGVQKGLQTSSNGGEYTNTEVLNSFNSDGFTVGDSGGVNTNSNNYVAWNWKAGTTSIPSSGQSLTPTGMSYNATSGISIIRYDSTDTNPSTIPHGLGVTPEMVIFRNLDDTTNWLVYHKGLSSNKYLYLNSTDAESGSTDYIDVSSSLITLKTTWTAQNNGSNFMCYAFAPVQGYSKMGTFEGNGTAFPNSPFIYLGFKPKFFMWKNADDNTDGNDNWNIIDSTAQEYNSKDAGYLMANSSGYNFSGNTINFLSNGVKIDVASSYHNQSGDTYIYYAVGQSLVGSNNIPCTAR
tara:strand:+ start:20 stop:1078 length:1059 start_codon:yes stop_codon:yes gene_type:complete